MKNVVYIAIAVIGVYLYMTIFAEKPDKLVSEVTLTTSGNQKNLAIDFTTPVRYLGHFPENYGEILQIKIRAISFEGFDKNYSILGQIAKSGSSTDNLIRDVRYEGNVKGGPFLIIRFAKPLNYEVHEADGLSSLSISFDAT